MSQEKISHHAVRPQVKFGQLVGQDRIVEVLSRVLISGRMAHAYLFLGPEGSGKEAAVLDFARALLCDNGPGQDGDPAANIPCERCASCTQSNILAHPNLKVLFPLPKPKAGNDDDGGQEYSAQQQKLIGQEMSFKAGDYYHELNIKGGQDILVEHIRGFRHEFSLTSFSGNRRVAMISRADRLNQTAANAFLKLLEEPPPGVVFFLTSSRESKLLPTIVSRCQKLRFSPLPIETIAAELSERMGISAEQADSAARLSGGSWSKAREWAQGDPAGEMKKVVDLFRILVKGDPGELDLQVDRITGGSGDFPAMLVLMSQWLREVQRYDADPDGYPSKVEDEALIRFAKHCGGRDFALATEAVDKARLDLERRVQPALVAHNLFVRLWRVLFHHSTPQSSSQ